MDTLNIQVCTNGLYFLAVKLFIVFVTITFIILAFPVIGFFYLLRRTVALLGKLLIGLEIVPLFDGHMAAENVYDIQALSMSVTLVGNAPVINKSEIVQLVRDNLIGKRDQNGNVQFPELRCGLRPYLGYLFWEPVKHFDLEQHVVLYKDTGLPLPDWSDLDAMRKIASQMLRSRCWRKGAPLWEIILLNNVPRSHLPRNSCNGSLLIWRFHHVLMDGYGTFKVLMQLFDKYDKVKDSVVPTTMSIYDGKMTWEKFQAICTAPFKIGAAFLPMVLCPITLPAIFKGNGNKILSHASLTVPLDYIKALRKKHNVDLASVLIAVMAGGIRRFLLKYEQKIPNKLGILTPMPMPNHPDKLTNYVCGGIYPVPLREHNNINRLKEISAMNAIFRDNSVVPLTHWIGNLAGVFPQFLLIAFKTLFPLPPLFLSNVVGPIEQMLYDEMLITDIKVGINLPIHGPRGFCFAFLTYDGQATLAVSAYNEYLKSNKHADELMKYCREEMKELE
ncbi:uncharacterized protein LOC110860912 [Folsomia candida]|uniref:Putative diacylglycerol O-acyltransferase tgs1 n=1 Tax=Folsomia candida TaxID=158441 RepID=A0A226D4F1_FOLCA|nr:uncharacterized protein LOC110860912 [Folsomia candida]OXA40063.1 putative diacylglycerol O-acyltransferase tgs1 [Folsomia candida]